MTAPLKFDGLSFALIARLRGHGHLCNVLTHVGSGNWRAIEQSIASILRPRARVSHLDAIARNIVELVTDGRGTTGPIMHAVFYETVTRETGAEQAKRIKRKIDRLREGIRVAGRQQLDRIAEQPAPVADGNNENQPTEITPREKAPLHKAA